MGDIHVLLENEENIVQLDKMMKKYKKNKIFYDIEEKLFGYEI